MDKIAVMAAGSACSDNTLAASPGETSIGTGVGRCAVGRLNTRSGARAGGAAVSFGSPINTVSSVRSPSFPEVGDGTAN
jgi:hypothetical protein